MLENNEMVRHLANEGQVMFGTIDTWLVYRLTEGKVRHWKLNDRFIEQDDQKGQRKQYKTKEGIAVVWPLSGVCHRLLQCQWYSPL